MRQLRPVVWLPLGLPIGVSSGFIAAGIANELARSGVSEAGVSDVVAVFCLATSFGVLWGPIVDASISRRFGVIFGVVLTAAALGVVTLATGQVGMPVLTVCTFAAGSGTIIVGLASKSIAAYTLPLEQRALAGAWYSAGNLGSTSAAGAGRIWLLTSVSSRPLIASIEFHLPCCNLKCATALKTRIDAWYTDALDTSHGITSVTCSPGRVSPD